MSLDTRVDLSTHLMCLSPCLALYKDRDPYVNFFIVT